MAGKIPITLKLNEAEIKILEDLCVQKDMTKSAVLRQALRLYQLTEVRLSRGEKLFFGTDEVKQKAEVMLL